ncbi:hypothetical protein [Nocardioides nitrophenolicus]|uniref:hypothetical protein n=1 Tax=Nocardioides nitrophenolicus TaxID=60489 RepID=UPI00195751D6|nr:hypothetical protein [Nocardioides nitrophenolicus]MBM7518392.1 hypothetical protein [Nocardioides nitrophenolicus]
MRRAAVHLLAGVALAVSATACGDDTADPPGADAPGADTADPPGDTAANVPEECRAAFPQALEQPDLGEIALLPDGFPEPPVDATLCVTAETVGGAQETASYASPASAEEVLAGYETALASYGAARDRDGVGRPIVTANAGEVVIQVTPQEGGFVLAFAR